MSEHPDDLLERALERLAETGPEFHGGLSNHGPMAVEALHHLGRADAIAAWLDGYLPQLEPCEPARGRAPKLAAIADWAEWQRLFADELAVSEWRFVVARWLPLLGPGLFAGATHGLLRTAHAIRMLRTRDTPLRRAELASGLAYWAASHQTLPGEVRPRGRRRAAELLAELPAIAHEGWLITEAIHGIDRVPELPALLSELDPDELTPARLLAAVAPWAAAGASVSAIVHVHVITSTVALLQLEDLLARDEFTGLLAHAWHAVAALIGTWRPAGPQQAPARAQIERELLITRGLASRDEHGIKLVDACLTGFEQFGDVTLLHAADALLAAMPTASPG
ncbi:hypothetical protein ACNOYE_32485 [Nannocystaceae bacterium ST9]